MVWTKLFLWISGSLLRPMRNDAYVINLFALLLDLITIFLDLLYLFHMYPSPHGRCAVPQQIAILF